MARRGSAPKADSTEYKGPGCRRPDCTQALEDQHQRGWLVQWGLVRCCKRSTTRLTPRQAIGCGGWFSSLPIARSPCPPALLLCAFLEVGHSAAPIFSRIPQSMPVLGQTSELGRITPTYPNLRGLLTPVGYGLPKDQSLESWRARSMQGN